MQQYFLVIFTATSRLKNDKMQEGFMNLPFNVSIASITIGVAAITMFSIGYLETSTISRIVSTIIYIIDESNVR